MYCDAGVRTLIYLDLPVATTLASHTITDTLKTQRQGHLDRDT